MMINQVKDNFLQKNIKKKGLRIPRLVHVSGSSAMGKLRQKALLDSPSNTQELWNKEGRKRKKEEEGEG